MSDDPIAMLASVRSSTPTPVSRAHLWPLIMIVMVLLAIAVGFFGDRNAVPVTEPTVVGTPERDPRVYTVSYRFGAFSPTNLRIHAGDTVRFRNDGLFAIRIIAEVQPGAGSPEFDSVGKVQPDSYFAYTFARTGTFGYYNEANRNEAGVIIVR